MDQASTFAKWPFPANWPNVANPQGYLVTDPTVIASLFALAQRAGGAYLASRNLGASSMDTRPVLYLGKQPPSIAAEDFTWVPLPVTNLPMFVTEACSASPLGEPLPPPSTTLHYPSGADPIPRKRWAESQVQHYLAGALHMSDPQDIAS